MAGIYEEEVKTKSPKEALISAVDTVATYTFRCLTIAPSTVRFFDAVAKAMLVVDKANNYKYNELMNRVFIERQILRAPYKPMVVDFSPLNLYHSTITLLYIGISLPSFPFNPSLGEAKDLWQV